ncbi:MAG: hypothetical protein MZV64_72940 [Ignavibacteriales bacterium]|nr:hypothetical protein [Ignavibacteriales bacterium]
MSGAPLAALSMRCRHEATAAVAFVVLAALAGWRVRAEGRAAGAGRRPALPGFRLPGVRRIASATPVRGRGSRTPGAACRPATSKGAESDFGAAGPAAAGLLSGRRRAGLRAARAGQAERRAWPASTRASAQAPRYGPALAGRGEALLAAGQRRRGARRVRGGAGRGRRASGTSGAGSTP